jgi:hypothetical protein
MVQSLIQIDEKEDRILNIVKAKYGLKNKSEAVALIANIYEDSFLEPELRPEYIQKLKKIKKGKFIKYSSLGELRKATN